MPYGDRWRDHRRLLQKTFGNLSENTIFFLYELKDCRRHLLESPDGLFDHLLQMAGETIEYTYGLEIKPQNDPYVTTAFEAAHTLFTAAIPGAFLVDSLPVVDKSFEAAKKNITLAAIASCILALLHNPSIVQKTRKEIDRVVGPNRLPYLPYVKAITKEPLRWRDVAPI
ncbi:hypothetical protein H0H93_007559, partial [Arthromyces matolae]